MSVDSLKTSPSPRSAPRGHLRREGPPGRQLAPGPRALQKPWGSHRAHPAAPSRGERRVCVGRDEALTPPAPPPAATAPEGRQQPPSARRQSSPARLGPAPCAAACEGAAPAERAERGGSGRRTGGGGAEEGRRRAGRGRPRRGARPRPFVQRPARLSARGAEVIEREGRGRGLGSDGV